MPEAMLKLPATANLGAAAELAQRLQQQIDAGSGEVVVDASALQVCDTATIALLLQLRRAAMAAGRGFALRQPPPKLVQLAQLYGVNELLATTPA